MKFTKAEWAQMIIAGLLVVGVIANTMSVIMVTGKSRPIENPTPRAGMIIQPNQQAALVAQYNPNVVAIVVATIVSVLVLCGYVIIRIIDKAYKRIE